MPRAIDVAKVLQLASESKLVNLDVNLKEVAKSGLVGFGAHLDEPWDLICADWMTVIRRGPRFDSVIDVAELAGALRQNLASGAKTR
jgi:hypothetical protein